MGGILGQICMMSFVNAPLLSYIHYSDPGCSQLVHYSVLIVIGYCCRDIFVIRLSIDKFVQ